MDAGNGDRGELLRPGGILSAFVGVCLAVAGGVLSLVVVYALGWWQPDLPYLTTLANLMPVEAGNSLLIAALVMLLLGLVAVIGGALIVKGSGEDGRLSGIGGLLGIFVGVCLVVAGAMVALVVVYETGVWRPDLPYLSRLGGLLPVEAGNRFFIGSVVVLALGIGAVIAGASAVRRAGTAIALASEGLAYLGSERTAPRTVLARAPGGAATEVKPPAVGLRTAATEARTPATRVLPKTPQPVVSASTGAPHETTEGEVVARRSRTEVEPLETTRLARAKAGFCTRRVPKEDMRTVVTGSVRPRAGDVVLARIERLRQHRRLELVNGRKARLEPGDEVILACGNRYAADQFEGFVPEKLGPAHLIAAGGMAAVEAQRARRMKAPTAITLLGLVGDGSGVPLNLASYALPAPKVEGTRPPVVAVFGTSMNAGKTTAVSYLCRGLTAAGFKVGYAKLTGTGAGNDFWRVLDSGACAVLDFTDAGLVSTYRTPVSVLELTSAYLVGHLMVHGCDRIVVEIADGLMQTETNAVMRSEAFHTLIDRVVFTGGDAMSAIGGVRMLQEHGFDVACVSGLLTTSPLASREAAAGLNVPVLCNEDLASAETAIRLVNHEALPRGMGCGRTARLAGDEHGQSAQLDEGSDSMEDEE